MKMTTSILPVLALAFAGLLVAMAACTPDPTDVPPDAERADGRPAANGTAYLLEHDERAGEILAEMSLDEKIGQMTQPDASYIEDPSAVTEYHLGSVLSGGNTDPSPANTFEEWREMVEGYMERSAETGIPLLYGVDAVHGHANVVGAVVFPHNIGLGATRNAELVERVYRATAVETRATGINWNFAPCVAVPRDIRWGRTYEGFAEDPQLVAELGAAAVRGLQGDGLGDPRGVLACAKHWVGDGGTTFGTGAPKEGVPASVFEGVEGAEAEAAQVAEGNRWPLDRGDTRVDEETLRRIHMPGYLTAIEEGVGSIMVSFSSWNGERLSGHRYLVTDVLKEELGFHGFVVSDWASIDDIPGEYTSDIEDSINAGLDMVMVPDRYQEFFTKAKRLVEEGKIPMERIDDAVRRILRVKIAMGLLDEGAEIEADPALESEFGSEAHRELGRQAVRESLVLLANDDGVLPLAKDSGRIHVVGKSANDLGNQCGGWTIAWQGQSGEDVTEGTTVLEAIRAAVGEGTEVTFSEDGSGAEGADVVVAVIGEEPYAEMMGDRVSLDLAEEDVATIERAAGAGVPVVTVLISGRPMVLGETLDRSAAFVAAWLPGTEGAGVTDVLFGDHPPTGKLPFTWPRTNEQLPIQETEEGGEALFPYGFGLGY